MSGEFVDTNVLLYAYDRAAGRRHERAADLVGRLFLERSGLLSTQVLMEFYAAATRKLPQKLDSRTAAAVIEDLGAWPVFSPAVGDILAGVALADRHRIHFWDGMIVRAALALGAEVLWSEDLNHGQDYGGVVVRNPFA